jgi:hypothetical protein
MNRYISLSAVLFVLLFSVSALSQEAFEGKVKFRINDDSQSMDMNYFVKDGKIKVDVEGESNSSIIFNSQSQSMLIVMPEEKMYMDMPIKPDVSANRNDQKGDFKKTNEKKDILGYSTEKWVYKDDENEVESWLTKELGSFVFFSNAMEKREKTAWEKKFESEGYFPLLMVVKDNKGKVTSSMEVISVEKQSLSSDMFSPPAGYQKISIPGM